MKGEIKANGDSSQGFFLSELKRKMALVWEGDYDAQNIIVPWLLGGNLSSAGEAANSPRGRDKWR